MESIAIIGLGYVGLRAALAFSKHIPKTIGFDIKSDRVDELRRGIDHNFDTSAEELQRTSIHFTQDIHDLLGLDVYIIDVQTPTDEYTTPDLSAVTSASTIVGQSLKKGSLIVCESTVYPGLTEEVVVPILEKSSGLKAGVDFYVGYSPERIVPGERGFDLTETNKIISGYNESSLHKVLALYSLIMPGKLFCARSMKAAEAAKLLENIQRDVNIALMNEFAQVMKKMDVSIYDVLEAAGTKWNFLPFSPGFVGGHCIPIDPYYLIHRAKKVGAGTRLIEAARFSNEALVHFVLDALLSYSVKKGREANLTKVAVVGISFKKNVADTRHSLSIKLYHKLVSLGYDVVACDPLAFKEPLADEMQFVDWDTLNNVDIAIITIGHDCFKEAGLEGFKRKLNKDGLLMDLPGLFYPVADQRLEYWSL